MSIISSLGCDRRLGVILSGIDYPPTRQSWFLAIRRSERPRGTGRASKRSVVPVTRKS
jgi:hypothetical protein